MLKCKIYVTHRLLNRKIADINHFRRLDICSFQIIGHGSTRVAISRSVSLAPSMRFANGPCASNLCFTDESQLALIGHNPKRLSRKKARNQRRTRVRMQLTAIVNLLVVKIRL